MGRGVVGLEPDRLALCGDRLVTPSPGRPGRCRGCSGPSAWSGLSRIASRNAAIASSHLPLAAQGVAEVVVGLGGVGLEPDRLAECGDGLVDLPLPARAMPRLQWASAKSGLSRIASRYAATASSHLPLADTGRCRGCSGPRRRRAGAGWPRGRRRRPGRGSAAASAARPLSLQVSPQAAQVRPFSGRRSVRSRKTASASAPRPIRQAVGQLVGRLGAQGAGRRVVPHRLLAGRRPQPVQGIRPGRS